jgi:hypothetical protein
VHLGGQGKGFTYARILSFGWGCGFFYAFTIETIALYVIDIIIKNSARAEDNAMSYH